MKRGIEADPAQHLGRHSRRMSRAGTMPCTTGASPMMSTTRMRGLSDAIGSWKIICTASCARPRARRRPASRRRAPLDSACCPSLGSQDAGDDAAERRLAAAGFADQADHLALADRRGRRRRRRAPTSSRQPGAEQVARACSARSSGLTKRLRDAVELDERASRHAAAPRRRADGWQRAGARARWRRQPGSARGRSRVGARAARRERRSPAAGCASEGVMPGICAQRLAALVAARHRADQAARVGMQRRVEHVVDRPGLDDAARIHHGDAVGEAGDDREIVGDPDQRRAGLGGRASAPRRGSAPGW